VSDAEHVHTRACDRVARIVGHDQGREVSWSISAWCCDDETTIREHVARWRPSLVVVSITFE
jgi:hypothetical protein